MTHPLIERKLELLMLDKSRMEPITRPGEHPPCFDSQRAYEDWLEACDQAAKTGVPLPTRKTWPGEPNYCRECSPEHRNQMRKEGRCLFPSTIFVEDGEGEDSEIVGDEL